MCVCVCVCVCEREKKRKRQREQREQQQQTTTALPVFHFRRFQKVDNVGLVCFELQPSCTQQCLTVRHTHGPTHDFRVHPEQQQRKMGFRTDGIRFRVPFRFTQLHRTRGGEEERRRGGEKVLVDSSHFVSWKCPAIVVVVVVRNINPDQRCDEKVVFFVQIDLPLSISQ